ncbi:MAG TPA: hypothetical protein VNN77_15925 [candidate division Zixibacteria bacterium]|nr:hypothetical protein [candidate division Zixibacteria bacterium]
MKAFASDLVEIEDSLEAVNEWFCRERLSDGLPIVPPTPERVERMLEGTSRDPAEVAGLIPPRWAPATVEKIAINAVMAGCLPQYMPVLIAAVQAMVEPRFNLYGVQATTGYVGPALMLNGPVRRELEINCDAGVFGPGFRANATIGRAIRLILITIGGGIPGETDRATFGWPGKYTFCFGENEEKSPWEPYHVERGFGPEQSTVTVCGINGFLPIHTAGSRGEEALASLAEVIAMHRGVSHLDVGSFGGGTPMVALGVEDAEIMARDGITKRRVKEYLWEHASLPFEKIPARRKGHKSDEDLLRESPNVTADGIVHLAARPEDIIVAVLGGKHRHSVFLPMWTGRNTLSVTRPVGR